MIIQKLFIIIVVSLLPTIIKARSFNFSGLDGDGHSCLFSYNTKNKLGILQMNSFDLIKIKMKYFKNFQENYLDVIAGKIPYSNYSIVAEGSQNTNLNSILNSLNLITIIERHDHHAHVWFCHSIIQENQL